MHPHCTLRISRSVAPDDRWHWLVEMPDGHIFDVSGPFINFNELMSDAALKGGLALLKADAAWRGCVPNSVGDHPNNRPASDAMGYDGVRY